MAQLSVNFGLAPNDGSGDPFLAAGNAVSANFTDLYSAVSALSAVVSNAASAVTANSAQMTSAAAALSNAVSALSVVVSNSASAINALSAVVSNRTSAIVANSAQMTSADNAISQAVSVLSAATLSSLPRKVTLTGDQVLSVSTLGNISGLLFSVDAGNTYHFKYFLIYQSGSTVSGLGLTLTFPAMTAFAATAAIDSGVAGTGWFSGAITSSGARVQAVSVQTAATDFYATIEGVCKVSVNGTLRPQFAPEVAGQSAIATIRQGSSGMLWRIA